MGIKFLCFFYEVKLPVKMSIVGSKTIITIVFSHSDLNIFQGL